MAFDVMEIRNLSKRAFQFLSREVECVVIDVLAGVLKSLQQ